MVKIQKFELLRQRGSIQGFQTISTNLFSYHLVSYGITASEAFGLGMVQRMVIFR